MDHASLVKKLDGCSPRLQDAGINLFDRCVEAGIDLLITQGLRTVAEQDRIFQIGRTLPPLGRTVSNARGGYSYHNYGLAFDVVPLVGGKCVWQATSPLWTELGKLGRLVGLEWGGDFKGKFKDKPHFQLSNGVSVFTLLEIYKDLPPDKNLTPIWDLVNAQKPTH